jgi:predicted metal-dependent HD superfamily phosphohydrolase
MIKEEFIQSLKHYTANGEQIRALWDDVEHSYSSTGRHYHNLTHLNHLTKELQPYKASFNNWDVVVLAIAYHDIVYNALKSNNEEKSADLAVKKLAVLSCPEILISRCQQLILATKKHQGGDQEINLFTDADLSILGSAEETYKTYAGQIRQEYSMYPDFVYYPGRKKVLRHFLSMDKIYKSPDFEDKYESSARINLQAELDSISRHL